MVEANMVRHGIKIKRAQKNRSSSSKHKPKSHKSRHVTSKKSRHVPALVHKAKVSYFIEGFTIYLGYVHRCSCMQCVCLQQNCLCIALQSNIFIILERNVWQEKTWLRKETHNQIKTGQDFYWQTQDWLKESGWYLKNNVYERAFPHPGSADYHSQWDSSKRRCII